MTAGTACGYLKTSAGWRSLPCLITLHYDLDELGHRDIVVTLRAALVTLVDGESVLSESLGKYDLLEGQGCRVEVSELNIS